MATAEEEYAAIVSSAKRPVAGQSLTNDPESPALYERPPEFTSVHAASEYMFGKFIEPDTYVSTMKAINIYIVGSTIIIIKSGLNLPFLNSINNKV